MTARRAVLPALFAGRLGESLLDAGEDFGPVLLLEDRERREHAEAVGAVAAVEEDDALVEDGLAGLGDLLFVAGEGGEARHAAEAAGVALEAGGLGEPLRVFLGEGLALAGEGGVGAAGRALGAVEVAIAQALDDALADAERDALAEEGAGEQARAGVVV